jgi:hypothetical protein
MTSRWMPWVLPCPEGVTAVMRLTAAGSTSAVADAGLQVDGWVTLLTSKDVSLHPCHQLLPEA